MSLRALAAAFLSALRHFIARFAHEVKTLLRTSTTNKPIPGAAENVGACCFGLDYVKAKPSLRLWSCAVDASRFAAHFLKLGAGRAVVVSDNATAVAASPSLRTFAQHVQVVSTRGHATDIVELLVQTISGSTRGSTTPARSSKESLDARAKECALIVTISCHGLQVPDDNGDELDGFDEALIGTDGVLVRDDTLRQCIEEGARRHPGKLSFIACILDFCHSGTALDLRYGYDPESKQWTEYGANPSQASPEVASPLETDESLLLVTLAGCLPTGVSYEEGVSGGIFSNAVRTHMPNFASSVLDCFDRASSEVLQYKGSEQTPMLCSSRPFSRNLCFDGHERFPQ